MGIGVEEKVFKGGGEGGGEGGVFIEDIKRIHGRY